MSYTRINGMRSTRYPLQGVGCPCGVQGLGDAGAGMSNVTKVALAGAVLIAITAKASSLKANRRRRRRRR